MLSKVSAKWTVVMLTLLLGGLFTLSSTIASTEAQSSNNPVAHLSPVAPTEAQSNNDPFVYPKHGQVLNHGQGYMVLGTHVEGVNDAHSYWISMGSASAGYINWRDEGHLFRYINVWPGHPRHSDFRVNEAAYLSIFAYVDGRWVAQGSIRIMLADPALVPLIEQIKGNVDTRTSNNPIIHSITPSKWSSDTLGCPAKGQQAKGAIVDGYEIIYHTDDSAEYKYHTNGKEEFVFCGMSQTKDLESK